MTVLDRIILLATGLVLIFALGSLWREHRATKPHNGHIGFHFASLFVFLISGLLLIAFGWDVLGNDMVAIVASIIPFGLAVGLVREFYPTQANRILVVLGIGLLTISATRFADLGAAAKIAYPVFHSLAALIVVVVPVLAVRSGQRPARFVAVSAGGALISTGGIALAFLSAGKQLLFLSHEMVLFIFAPLLLATAACFALGLTAGRAALRSSEKAQ